MLFKNRKENNSKEEVLDTKLSSQSTEDINIISNEVGGYPWNVTFYNNITKKEDAVTSLDINTSPAIQSYRLIENLEIKLESGIDDNDINNITGEGWINIGSKIYKHDLFKAKVKGNRVALFELTDVKDRRYENTELARVSFKVIAFDDTDSETFENLNNKVATNYSYNKDFKDSNSSPIISKSTELRYQDMSNNLRLMLNRYLNKYLDDSTSTLCVETGHGNLVDPFLNDFFSKVFSSDISKSVQLSSVVSFDKRSSSFNIFNALMGEALLENVDKLHFSKPDFNPYYRILSKASHSVKSKGTDKEIINGLTYFVPEELYDENYETEDEFEIYLLNHINEENPELSAFEKYLFDLPLDFNGYFRIPILLYMYKLHILSLMR